MYAGYSCERPPAMSDKPAISVEQSLYQEIIIENWRATENRRQLANPDRQAGGANPSCGDELELFARIEDDHLVEISYLGAGCSICCASANMLCEALIQLSLGAGTSDCGHLPRHAALGGGAKRGGRRKRQTQCPTFRRSPPTWRLCRGCAIIRCASSVRYWRGAHWRI